MVVAAAAARRDRTRPAVTSVFPTSVLAPKTKWVRRTLDAAAAGVAAMVRCSYWGSTTRAKGPALTTRTRQAHRSSPPEGARARWRAGWPRSRKILTTRILSRLPASSGAAPRARGSPCFLCSLSFRGAFLSRSPALCNNPRPVRAINKQQNPPIRP